MGTVKINNGDGKQVKINSPDDSTPVTINQQEVVPVTPDAPTIIQQNNTTKQIWFQAPSGYAANQCAYKVQGGSAINATSTIIQFNGDADLSIGDVEIYVKAAPGINQSDSVFSTEAFTPEIFMTGVTAHSEAEADFYTAGTNGMFLNMAEITRVTVAGTAIKVSFNLAAIPPALTLFWIFIYRKDGATYDLIEGWQLTPKGDMVVGVNEWYLPASFDIQVGDYIGWAHSGNSGMVAMYPRTETESGTDISRATIISLGSNKDFDGGTLFTTGYYPIILKGL